MSPENGEELKHEGREDLHNSTLCAGMSELHADSTEDATCLPLPAPSSIDLAAIVQSVSSNDDPRDRADNIEGVEGQQQVKDVGESEGGDTDIERDSDDDTTQYNGLRIPVTSSEFPTIQYLEILETLSGSTAGTFRVRHVDSDAERDKSTLINQGERFILKIYAPEFTQKWSPRYHYKLSPSLQQAHEASVQDGSYQDFVDSLQKEIPAQSIPRDILAIIEFRPISRVDILWLCYRAAELPGDPIDIAVKAGLISPEDVSPTGLLRLRTHISRCQLIKEITVLDHVAPLVHNHLPKKIGLFKQHMWWTPPGQLRIDCIATEEIHGYPLQHLKDVCRGKKSPDEIKVPIDHIASQDSTTMQKFFAAASDLLHILPAIGYIHGGAYNHNNIMVRLDREGNFLDLCFVDAASVGPLRSAPDVAEDFEQSIDTIVKRVDLCLPTTIRISRASFGHLLNPQDVDCETEADVERSLNILFEKVDGKLAVDSRTYMPLGPQNHHSVYDETAWLAVMLAASEASCDYYEDLYYWRLFAASLMYHHWLEVDRSISSTVLPRLGWLRLVFKDIETFCVGLFGHSTLDDIEDVMGMVFAEIDQNRTIQDMSRSIAAEIWLFQRVDTNEKRIFGRELWEPMEKYLGERNIKLIHPCRDNDQYLAEISMK